MMNSNRVYSYKSGDDYMHADSIPYKSYTTIQNDAGIELL